MKANLILTVDGREYTVDLSKGIGDSTYDEYRWVDKFGVINWKYNKDAGFSFEEE